MIALNDPGLWPDQPARWLVDGMLTSNKPKKRPARKERQKHLLKFLGPVIAPRTTNTAVETVIHYASTGAKKTFEGLSVLELFLSPETVAVSNRKVCIKEELIYRYSKERAERFLFLKTEAQNDPDVGDLSVPSQRSFEAFWASNSNLRLKLPDITLTPDGDVYARWSAADGSVFSAHFLPDYTVKAILFKPDPDNCGNKIRRFIGPTPVDSLVGSLIAQEDISWACD